MDLNTVLSISGLLISFAGIFFVRDTNNSKNFTLTNQSNNNISIDNSVNIDNRIIINQKIEHKNIRQPSNNTSNTSDGELWIFVGILLVGLLIFGYANYKQFILLCVSSLCLIGAMGSLLYVRFWGQDLIKMTRFYVTFGWFPVFFIQYLFLHPPFVPSNFPQFSAQLGHPHFMDAIILYFTLMPDYSQEIFFIILQLLGLAFSVLVMVTLLFDLARLMRNKELSEQVIKDSIKINSFLFLISVLFVSGLAIKIPIWFSHLVL